MWARRLVSTLMTGLVLIAGAGDGPIQDLLRIVSERGPGKLSACTPNFPAIASNPIDVAQCRPCWDDFGETWASSRGIALQYLESEPTLVELFKGFLIC